MVFLWERVEGPRTPEGGLTGKGGVVRVGMGWERWERGERWEQEYELQGWGGILGEKLGGNGRGESFFRGM